MTADFDNKLLFFFILGAIYLATAVTASTPKESKNILYFQHVDLYPLEKKHIKHLLLDLPYKGYTEAQLLSGIQKKFFFLLPYASGPLKNYIKGAYQVTIISNQRIFEQIESGMKIILTFDPRSKPEKIQRKKIYLFNDLLDEVIYEFQNGNLSRASSRLYGIIYFTKPKNFFNTIMREIKSYFYAVFS